MLENVARKTDDDINPYSLQRSLTSIDLILLGIGGIIGAGVFVLTGVGAATKAGPAITLSYIISGLASLFAALAYAELAASIGGPGSAYSYANAGFGPFIGWMVGWTLLLEYIMSVATVAIGWSGYFNNLLTAMHISLPHALSAPPFEGGIINLPAVIMISLLAFILSLGMRESARFNAAIVLIKLITIGVFITVATTHIKLENWSVFFPFGFQGVMSGAAFVFFAYVGFDALSTAVEETINPSRDIPIGIIVSLIVCTLLYIIVALLLTGIAPFPSLNVRSPVAEALLRLGENTAAGFIAAGAIAGLTTTMLVLYYGFTRVGFAIARDGLLPKIMAKINPRTRTPIPTIIIGGILIALVAGFSPIDRTAELVNIGTLTAFVFVCVGVVILRVTRPNMPRPFKLPFSPIIPLLGALFCFYLMISLPTVTWERFGLWTALGVIIYIFQYVRR